MTLAVVVVRYVQEAAKPSVFLEVTVGVAVIAVGSFFTYIAHNFKEFRKLVDAMVTREPSDFDSEPPLGFIDQLKENTKETALNKEAVLAMTSRMGQNTDTIDKVSDDLKTLTVVVDSHGKSLATLLKGSEALIADSKPNDGSTSFDVLTAIRGEQERLRDQVEEG